jgi:hypothetical protein
MSRNWCRASTCSPWSRSPQRRCDCIRLPRLAQDEGLTLVLPRPEANAASLRYDYVAARITLRVHSNLAAVGLPAAVSGRLASAAISCNVIAGYHPDHLFVPFEKADRALDELARLTCAYQL